MKISDIENKIIKIDDLNSRKIIQLIVDAIKDFPLRNLDGTQEYFKEIKKIIKTQEINIITLKAALHHLSIDSSNGETIWIMTSINSLLDAFEMMQLHNISFEDVLKEIEMLSGN